MKKKTDARNVLSFIDSYHETMGYAPGVRDIQANLKISSTSIVTYWLKAYREQGLIDFTDNVARSVRLTKQGQELLEAKV